MSDLAQTTYINRILADLLQDRIVPELVKYSRESERMHASTVDTLSAFEFEKQEIVSFSQCLIENDIDAACQIVSNYSDAGCSAPNLVLDLLCNSARYLGELWCSDETSFAEVTIGMAGLHHILRYLDDRMTGVLDVSVSSQPRILFMPMPGDTHIFGVSVLETFFRHSGWNVRTDFEPSHAALIDIVAGEAFDVVGFSVGHTDAVSQCAAMTKLVRKHSINKNIKVMAGGSALPKVKDFKGVTGVDAVAGEVQAALELASTFCAPGTLDKTRMHLV